jgi:hypothetical protein
MELLMNYDNLQHFFNKKNNYEDGTNTLRSNKFMNNAIEMNFFNCRYYVINL